MDKPWNTVVETGLFVRQAKSILTEEDVDDLKNYLAIFTTAGDIIQGTGGMHKLRWARSGMGKRGGVRVIYYFYDETAPVFLLGVYAKSKQEDLTPSGQAMLTKMTTQLEYICKNKKRRT